MYRLFRAFCDTEKDFRYQTDIKEYAQKIRKANLEVTYLRISRKESQEYPKKNDIVLRLSSQLLLI